MFVRSLEVSDEKELFGVVQLPEFQKKVFSSYIHLVDVQEIIYDY